MRSSIVIRALEEINKGLGSNNREMSEILGSGGREDLENERKAALWNEGKCGQRLGVGA